MPGLIENVSRGGTWWLMSASKCLPVIGYRSIFQEARGKIINISSTGQAGIEWIPHYSASKQGSLCFLSSRIAVGSIQCQHPQSVPNGLDTFVGK
jgi:hypothetical protein